MSDDSDPFRHIWEMHAEVHDEDAVVDPAAFKPAQAGEEDFVRNLNTPAPAEVELFNSNPNAPTPADLFDSNLNTPAPVNHQENNTNIESSIEAKDNQSNGHVATDDSSIIWPVLPGESGEGHPYAPADWPNPGDNWIWKVGRRYNASGYFQDRFLYPPKSLQKSFGTKMFASLSTLESYINTHFPGADVKAFLASFTWKIPAKLQTPSKDAVGSTEAAPQDGKSERRRSGRPKKQPPQPAPSETIADKEANEGTEQDKGGSLRRSGRPRKQPQLNLSETLPEEENDEAVPAGRRKRKSAASDLSEPSNLKPAKRSGPYKRRSSAANEVEVAVEEIVIPPDFDNYLDSLDEIIAQPIIPAGNDSSKEPAFAAEAEMAEARRKLSSYLIMDFSSLVSSRKLNEVLSLAAKIQKDPRLTADQLVKLKLIEEIPSFKDVFFESRKVVTEVDNMFKVLEDNKSRATNLKSEYNLLKERADELQRQVDTNLMTVQEIDNQIAQLQNWKAELAGKIENNKAAKAEVNKAQKVVAGDIPGLVKEIQEANSKAPEWHLKKVNAQKREAEVLAKFVPLHRFSL